MSDRPIMTKEDAFARLRKAKGRVGLWALTGTADLATLQEDLEYCLMGVKVAREHEAAGKVPHA